MIKTFLIASIIFTAGFVSIYSIRIDGTDGSTINFNDFTGKRILIVNTASNSAQASQLTQLQELYAEQHDSLVVIAFPSNSFGNEPLADTSIKNLLQQTYGVTFPIAAKSKVKGSNANYLFKWLNNKIMNDVTTCEPRSDFNKFLISRQGHIVGIFDSSISPLSPIIAEAIQKN